MKQYPVLSTDNRCLRGSRADFNGTAPLPAPTDALPATEEKFDILEERVRLGQALHHPDDAKFDRR